MSVLMIAQNDLVRLLGICAAILDGEHIESSFGTFAVPEDMLREACDPICKQIGFSDLRDFKAQSLAHAASKSGEGK